MTGNVRTKENTRLVFGMDFVTGVLKTAEFKNKIDIGFGVGQFCGCELRLAVLRRFEDCLKRANKISRFSSLTKWTKRNRFAQDGMLRTLTVP